jgi:choline-phosphate cytidylyltransferase
VTKVITYGTYDLLHYGHIRLLERARELGDYLIVGVTSDDYDKTRGKINVQQKLEDRVEAVRATGIADKVIIEEYEGQKIDDIKRYDIDIFTVGSDWIGKFDYLKEYCKVMYLERTQGVSSTEIREKKQYIRLGLVGYSNYLNKVYNECQYVNGVRITSLCSRNTNNLVNKLKCLDVVTTEYDKFLDTIDAVYVHSNPLQHYEQVKRALIRGKHVLCESPIAITRFECERLFELAKVHNVVLMESLRTAYSTAYERLVLLLKGGKIGDIASIDAVCTSLSTNDNIISKEDNWGSMTAWGPTAMLPIFQVLGCGYKNKRIATKIDKEGLDIFTKVDFDYPHAVASIKVGIGVKSEGELIISGTQGYAYVPAPWWKTDYFEIRYENPANNKRYFYQLDGEGIRYEILEFLRAINGISFGMNIEHNVTRTISSVIEDFNKGEGISIIR